MLFSTFKVLLTLEASNWSTPSTSKMSEHVVSLAFSVKLRPRFLGYLHLMNPLRFVRFILLLFFFSRLNFLCSLVIVWFVFIISSCGFVRMLDGHTSYHIRTWWGRADSSHKPQWQGQGQIFKMYQLYNNPSCVLFIMRRQFFSYFRKS